MARGESTKVLIVDDSLFMRRVLRDIVQRAGHEVVGEAENGEAALREAPRVRPDLVTMDLIMPGMGGLECLRRLRDEQKSVRVVVVSALDQEAEVEQAMALGAADYIAKPFDDATVARTLAALST